MNDTWESMQGLLDSYWFMVSELERMVAQLEAKGCVWEDGAWVYPPDLERRLNQNAEKQPRLMP